MLQEIFQSYEKELSAFQQWIQANPRLPQSIGEIRTVFDFEQFVIKVSAISDKLLLVRYLKIYDFDLEKAKKLLVINLEMRKNYPTIFEKRDLLSDELQQALHTFHVYDLPQKTPENNKISVFRLVDDDPDKFVFVDVLRMASATLDGRFVRVDEGELISGDYVVFDMKGFGFKHLMKCVANLSLLRSYMTYAQDAVPFNVLQNHYINCSPVVSKLMKLVKPFMNKKLTDSLHFHTNMETLYETISPEYLPNELGGTAGNIEEMFDDWLKVLMTKR